MSFEDGDSQQEVPIDLYVGDPKDWIWNDSPVHDPDELGFKEKRSESEHARLFMLYGSLGIFAVTVLISFAIIILCSAATWDRSGDLLSSIIPVETLVIGAAVTYYFKTEQK